MHDTEEVAPLQTQAPTTPFAPEITPEDADTILSAPAPDEELLTEVRPLASQGESSKKSFLEKLQQTNTAHTLHMPRSGKNNNALTPYEKISLSKPREMDYQFPDITTPKYKLFNQRFWEERFIEEEKTLDDMAPYRIRAVYRIVRHMAEIRGIAIFDEPLTNALAVPLAMSDEMSYLDPYYTPSGAQNISLYMHLGTQYEKFLNSLFHLPSDEMVWFKNLNPKTRAEYPILQKTGLPLCPPPVPLKYLYLNTDTNALDIANDYSPHLDQALNLFIEEVRMIVDRLQIGAGTVNASESGFLGLQGIFDKDLIRIAWPRKEEILAFEFIMIEDAMNKIVNLGFTKARKELDAEYGFSLQEINGLMTMARDMAKRITEQSIEDDRAIATLRMENFIERAREALDLKAEMNANKQLALVTGLTRAEHDNEMKDMLEVVKKVSANSARKATQKVLKTSMPVITQKVLTVDAQNVK